MEYEKMDESRIGRINELARKAKTEGLTDAERAVLYAQYKFASSYYREDEIKKKELFILKRYMDEMVQMGNTVNIDQTKFERFNELIKVGEQ